MRNLQRIHHGGSHRITDRTKDCLQERRLADLPTACGEEGSSRPASAREIRALAARALRGAREVNLNWILLGLLGWGIGFLLVVVLQRTAGARDHAATREKTRDSFAGATTTKTDDPGTDRR